MKLLTNTILLIILIVAFTYRSFQLMVKSIKPVPLSVEAAVFNIRNLRHQSASVKATRDRILAVKNPLRGEDSKQSIFLNKYR
jgi:hypothetical protein